MQQILILGAGKSSTALIDYLVELAPAQNWEVVVADVSSDIAFQKTKGRSHTRAIAFSLNNHEERSALISAADVVVSMLPAALHLSIAADCLKWNKNLVTPSYIAPAMMEMDQAVREQGLIFMNEMGLDPGIDHMSALEILDQLRQEGATVTSYRSHCGGLVASACDDNSWHYKFSWNPRNVVLAGQGAGGMHWLENGRSCEISYEQLFETLRTIDLGSKGVYESYPNRDSLKYIDAYGLNGVKTMYRGTLRVPPFCRGWQQLVKAGLTDANRPYQFRSEENFEESLRPMLREIGIFDPSNFHSNRSAADDLQALLESRWAMKPNDRDLVVMVHEVEYTKNGQQYQLQSSLVIEGRDNVHTAMALTVGLPVAIVVKMILTKQLTATGVLMPNFKEVYQPVMKELAALGICFEEKINVYAA
ncbi:MAG: saccharopine dehydrogenase family protein [Chitinophagales bacterium]